MVTDVVGLSLLLPFTRRLWARLVRARLARAIDKGHIQVSGFGTPGMVDPTAFTRQWPDPGRRQPVIDVEAEGVDSPRRR